VAGSDLYPFFEGERVYELIGGDEAGRRIVHVGASTDRFAAAYRLAMGAERTEFWALDDEGAIVMPAAIDHKQRALTRFSPPLPIAPPELPIGEQQAVEVRMRVLDLENPRKQRESGAALRTIEYVGDERLLTPRGELTAHRIEIHFIADLTFADAETRTTCWVVPGQGMIATRMIEEIRILGFASERTQLTMVRVDAEPGAAPSGGANPTE
jgi:hypothetical protein